MDPTTPGEASAATIQPGASRKGTRLPAVDCLRYLAALAVIGWHTPERLEDARYHGLVTWAVPCFAAMAIYWLTIDLQRHPDQKYGVYLRKRVLRIGLPFLAWSLIYLAVRDIERVWIKHESAVALTWSTLWTGTAHHLWFLPFLIIVSAVFFLPLQWTVRRPHARAVLCAVAVLLGFCLALIPSPFDGNQYLLLQTWWALPAALWAIPLATYLADIASTASPFQRWGLLGFSIVLTGIQLSGWSSRLSTSLLGIALLMTSCQPWQHSVLTRLAPLGRLAYGVYLVHILFLIALRVAGHRCLHLEMGMMFNIPVFLLTAILSTLAVMALARSSFTRWLVPG